MEVVNSTTGDFRDTPGTACDVAIPSGTTTGDWLAAVVMTWGSPREYPEVTIEGFERIGWEEDGQTSDTSNAGHMTVLAREVDGSEDSPLIVETEEPRAIVVVLTTLRGEEITGIDIGDWFQGTYGSGDIVLPSVDVDEEVVLLAAGSGYGGYGAGPTMPLDGWQTRGQIGALSVASRITSASGSTGTVAMPMSGEGYRVGVQVYATTGDDPGPDPEPTGGTMVGPNGGVMRGPNGGVIRRSTTPVPPEQLFPTADSAGLPSGWTPNSTVTTDVQHSTPSAVIEDVRFDGSGGGSGWRWVQAQADNITYRRCHFLNVAMDNFIHGEGRPARNVTYEDCTWEKTTSNVGSGRQVAAGGIHDATLINCKIIGYVEGIQTGATASPATTLALYGCYIEIDLDGITNDVFHGDGIQYIPGNANLTIRWCRIGAPNHADNDASNASVFTQSNTGEVDIDGLIVSGGIWPITITQATTLTNVYVVEDTYSDATPIDVVGSVTGDFSAWMCTLDGNGQPIPGDPITL